MFINEKFGNKVKPSVSLINKTTEGRCIYLCLIYHQITSGYKLIRLLKLILPAVPNLELSSTPSYLWRDELSMGGGLIPPAFITLGVLLIGTFILLVDKSPLLKSLGIYELKSSLLARCPVGRATAPPST